MTRREKMLWILYGAVLILLFLLSSTDLIIKEKETQIYGISVIVEDTSDDNYVNFRKGMDRAAIELHADVSFITLYDKGSRQQQSELILREQQDGCKALIVSPVDAKQILDMQQDKQINIPLILLNWENGPAGDGIMSWLGFDYYSMGQELGEMICEDQEPGKRVYLFGEPDTVSVRFRDGVMSALETKGFETALLEGEKGESEEKAEKTADQEGKNAVFVALDPVSLTEMAQKISETGEESSMAGLYGRGTTARILNYLDKGIIKGLCITDDFSAGYLSVKLAVNLAENRIVEDMGYLESGCIRREDLRDVEYEKMVYPIE